MSSSQTEATHGLLQAGGQLAQLQTGTGGMIGTDSNLVGGFIDPLYIATQLIGDSILLATGTGNLDGHVGNLGDRFFNLLNATSVPATYSAAVKVSSPARWRLLATSRGTTRADRLPTQRKPLALSRLLG